jgi:aerobic-type carbon monoxide dehydrogenase small subunit (CoxS/CutS family)
MPGVLPALLQLLQEQHPARVCIAAGRALECLAPHNQDTIASQPGAFALLTQCLAAEEPAVRCSSAATLQRLAWLHAANAAAIVQCTPGAIQHLAAVLRDKESIKAREHAAAALANLCSSQGIKAAIGCQAGVVTGLVQLLEDAQAAVRAQAAAALKGLAANCVENQTRIGAVIGALQGLQVGRPCDCELAC